MPDLAWLRYSGQNPREEALVNIRDAIQGYLQSLQKHGEPIPGTITEEIIEIPV